MKESEIRYYKSVSNKRVDQEFFALGPDSGGSGYHIITLECRQLSKGDNLGEVHEINRAEFLAGLELFSIRIQMTIEDSIAPEDTPEVGEDFIIRSIYSLKDPNNNIEIHGFSNRPIDELIRFFDFAIDEEKGMKCRDIDGNIYMHIPHCILKDCLIEFETNE